VTNPLQPLRDRQGVFYFYRGRTALYALLRALEVRPGDEVIVQTYTCLAVTLPIIALGAIPVYVDVSPETYTIDPVALEARISPRARVLVVQHTFGIPANLKSLLRVAKGHGLALIEDCCHVHGSTYDGRPLGSFGIAGFYSFQWSKPVVVGRGGLAVVNDRAVAERVAELHASFAEPTAVEVGTLKAQYLAYRLLRASRFFAPLRRLIRSWSPAGVASGQFKRAELEYKPSGDYTKKMPAGIRRQLNSILDRGRENIERRQRIGRRLHTHAVQLGVSPLKLPERADTAFMRYPLLTNDQQRVLEEGWDRNIEVSQYFRSPIDPLNPDQWTRVGYAAGSCPVAEYLTKKTVTLPVHDWAREKDVDKILDFVTDMKVRGLLDVSTNGVTAAPRRVGSARLSSARQ
jgi:perosamine synthetase